MKKIIAIIICIITMFSLSATVFAYDYSGSERDSLIIDMASAIPDTQEENLLAELERVSEEYKCEVSFLITRSTNGKDITAYADDYYDYNGFGYGPGDDGIMLVVSIEDREFATTTYGKGIKAFTDYYLAELEDVFVPYLSDGEYANACYAYLLGCEDILFAYDDYMENDYALSFFSLKNIGFAVLVGLLVAFLYTHSLKSQLKTVKKKSTANEYLDVKSFKVTQKRDICLNSNVVKTPIPRDSGGSRGGSSTHRSSSGRSHGGSRGRF